MYEISITRMYRMWRSNGRTVQILILLHMYDWNSLLQMPSLCDMDMADPYKRSTRKALAHVLLDVDLAFALLLRPPGA